MSTLITTSNTSETINPKRILEDSCHNDRLFGIPTIVFRPEEFEVFSEKRGKVYHFSRADMTEYMRQKLTDFFNRQSGISDEQKEHIIGQYMAEASEELLVQTVNNLIVPQNFQSGCVAFPFRGIEGPFAHEST